jgi:hypothetical protein
MTGRHEEGSAMADEARRGAFLTLMAVLFGLLSLSNFTKALQHLRNPQVLGIVVLGHRFESVGANLLVGPIMGAVLAAYAFGLWRLRPWVVPLSIAYAFYVPTNLILFWYLQTGPDIPALGFIVTYLIVALGGSIGSALVIAYRRERLGL